MAQATQIFICTEAQTITSSICKSRFEPLTPAQFPESIFGDQRLIELYLIRADSTYDERSGSATVAPLLAIARKTKAASGGVFDLTFGANTASGLAYNITAAALETALNALASITSAGGVDVSGAAGGPFTVTWRTNGARALMTGTSIDLTPSSSLAINQVVAGDGSTRAVQSIRIQTRVAALVDSWTIKLDPLDGVTPIGWSGILDTRSVDLIEMLEGADSVSAACELEVTEGGQKTTLMQQDCTVIKDVITDASTTPQVIIAFATMADLTAAVAVETARATAAEALKAPIASPVFTGNPTAPTPATTDSDTSIATTAMVQAVQQAEWTQPTAISITAAGNSNVAAVSAQNRYLTQRINVTSGAYTATVTLQSASALAGDKRRFIVSMPVGLSNLVEMRNLTSGGTLLATVPMDGALARTWIGYSTFDGTNWGTVSLSPINVDEFVLANTAFRGDFIQSDGATSNRAQIYGPFDATSNPREWVAGAATLTIAGIVTVPMSSVSPSASIFIFASATNSDFAANMLKATISTDSFSVQQIGATTSDTRSFSYSSFRTAYVGQKIFIKITLTQGTTSPIIEVNGINISASFTTSTAGTPPAWLGAAMVPTYRLVGYNWPSGPAPIVTPILGTTSAADDAFYMSTGRWPAWLVAGGSAKNQWVTGNAGSLNTADANSVSGITSRHATASAVLGARTGGTGAYVMRGTNNGGADWDLWLDVSIPYPSMQAFSVSFWIRSNLSTGIISCGTFFGATGISSSASVALSTSWQQCSGIVYLGGGGTFTRIGFGRLGSTFGTTGDWYEIDDILIIPIGALSLPSIQPINVVDDVSGIGGNQGRLLGMTSVTDKTNWRISANTWTSGNQQILAGNVLDSTKDIIDFVEQSSTGTPTTTIGSASAGIQYKASSALTAGINPITLVTRKLASNEVWVNSNSTAVVRTTIVGHRTT